MRIDDPTLLTFTIACAGLIALAVLLLRFAARGTHAGARDAPAIAGWVLLSLGTVGLGMLALLQLTGRLGPEHLWFRAPSFYLAAAILLLVGVGWLRRPASPALRFGLPIIVLGCGAVAVFAGRLDGRAAPVAMLLPTLDVSAPALTYFDGEGTRHALSDLRGKVVLLNFWATWCVPCRREMPMLSNVHRQHADEGLVVLYVSLEDPDVIARFRSANSFDGIHGRLDQAADFYGAGKFYPLTYLITRDGRVAARWSGRPREDWLARQIAARL
jgi:cytochrome c biogenesis protein CcmG/thiol:disulfide interchange protein DsbE